MTVAPLLVVPPPHVAAADEALDHDHVHLDVDLRFELARLPVLQQHLRDRASRHLDPPRPLQLLHAPPVEAEPLLRDAPDDQ